MILIDLSQTLYSILLNSQAGPPNLELSRSMIFTTLLSYKKKLGSEFGEPVLALDSREGYWRKDIFPHYKANRKKGKDDPKWKDIYAIVNRVTGELREVLPWKIVYVPKAEADDIIAVLGDHYGNDKTVIVSSDKDYKQLQVKRGVRQWSAIMKKWIVSENPEGDLVDLILSGDASDGIPNVRSPADAFVNGIRQTPMTKKFKEEFIASGKGYQEVKERYEQNKRLIDFKEIPEDIRHNILSAYEDCSRGNINKLYRFLVANRMNSVLQNIDLFKVKPHELHSANIFFQ